MTPLRLVSKPLTGRDVQELTRARVQARQAQRLAESQARMRAQEQWRSEEAAKVRLRTKLEWTFCLLLLGAAFVATYYQVMWVALMLTACLLSWGGYLAFTQGPPEGE